MKPLILFLFGCIASSAAFGQPAKSSHYVHEKESGLSGDTIKSYSITWGPTEEFQGKELQWLDLDTLKANGARFRIWILTDGLPSESLVAARKQVARFIIQQGSAKPLEFRDRITGRAVLPSIGGWPHLLPRPAEPSSPEESTAEFPNRTRYLGNSYLLEKTETVSATGAPSNASVIELLPDVLVGVPSNTRQKDETRRYDGSDYQLVRLTRDDFKEMAEAGINCLRVDPEQLPWIEDLNVFYWGIGGKNIPYPECLYDSRYLGPTLFLDEPAVWTRDYVIRPKLAKDQAFRKAITPQVVLDAFREYFQTAWQNGPATGFLNELKTRPEINLGDMEWKQENLFSWETMVETAAWQLSQNSEVPSAMVFEPPGRVGTRRTLPELDMTYGCQLPVDDSKNFTSIIYGFLRGAARLTGKSWGTSIYGAVDRTDAFEFLTHAYDLGATRFFFWDNAVISCVPYHECLALARALKMRIENHPNRDLERLRRAAEVAVLLPPGYGLGHVALGKGSLWGLGELNLERVNGRNVRYREIMSNFFVEIERCLRQGVAFDLLWDLPNLKLADYREVVRIREDGKVEVSESGQTTIFDHPRLPARPSGAAPKLAVSLSQAGGKAPLNLTARASVTETTAPVFYTFGTDNRGVYHNAMVAWELYGPNEEDYRFLTPPGLKPHVVKKEHDAEVTVEFRLSRPGNYHLRAATVDMAGRNTSVWTPITVTAE